MQEEYTTVVDLLADTIAEVISLDIENRSHCVELSRFNSDLPTNKEERASVLNALKNAVKREVGDADVYITVIDGEEFLFIEEL